MGPRLSFFFLSPANTLAHSRLYCLLGTGLKDTDFVFVVNSLPFLLNWNVIKPTSSLTIFPSTLYLCFPATWELTLHQGTAWQTPCCVLKCGATSGDLAVNIGQIPQELGHRGKKNTLALGKAVAFSPSGVWHDLASRRYNSPLPVRWSKTPKSFSVENFRSRSFHKHE